MVCSLLSFTRDERGFVVSTELVLIATVCVLGLITALTCVRDAVNAELQDVAGAIGSLNQSYRFSGFHGCISPKCGVHAWTAGSAFGDLQDEGIPAIEGGAATLPAPVRTVEPQPCPAPQPAPTPCPTTVPSAVPCPACETAATVAAPAPCTGCASVVESCRGCGTVADGCSGCGIPACSGRVETVAPVLAAPTGVCPQPACGSYPVNAPACTGGVLIW